MKITNTLGLPESFVQMAQREYEAEPNEYRTTSLLKGTREVILERRHSDKIEQDVSDMIWLLLGVATHNVLERYDEKDHEIKEERLKIEIGDYLLSGQFDLYNAKTKTVTDYKTCSVWKLMFNDFEDWRRQLLIYAYMLRKIGFEVNTGEIVAIIKDHSKRDAKYKADYPKLPVSRIKFFFDQEDFEECEQWLENRFKEIAAAELLSDDDLPICTPEQRFNSGDKFAVKKKGRKTAVRVLDTLEEAEQWVANGKGDFVEVRQGEDKKCMDGYCRVASFCSHYKELSKESENM